MKRENLKRISVVTLILSVVFLASGFVGAQLTPGRAIDRTKPMKLKGAVNFIRFGSAEQAFLLLDVRDTATNVVQQWVLIGNVREQLIKDGWTLLVPRSRNRASSTAPVHTSSGSKSPSPPTPPPPPPPPYRGVAVTVVAYPVRANVRLDDVVGPLPSIGNLRETLMSAYRAERLMYGTEISFTDGKKLVFGTLK